MNRIEKGLHEHHASIQAAGPPKEASADVAAGPAGERQPEPAIETPFARVNTVESGSPAHEANLKAGDKIRTFGSANWTNHENLRKVAEVVQRNEGVRTLSPNRGCHLLTFLHQRPILVKVVRDSQELQLRVTPRRNWGGRGTLGCHIVPI
jgi:26S proteasome regulatory subunit N4